MFRMPRALAMARAPYGPHTDIHVHVLVVDRGWWWVHEKLHELGRAEDRTQDGPWFPHRENQEKWPGPPTKQRALRAYWRIRPCPSPPLGVVAPHRIPRLAAVACLARYASSLAGVTFTPAQPPSVINSPCEKTNLTQKQPSRCELVKGLNV